MTSLLGIDYGRKRIGLATCGPLKIAHPAGVINRKNLSWDLKELEAYIKKYEIKMVVVGLPKNMNNSCGEMAQEATQFANTIKENFHDLKIELWDERLTTWQAQRMLLETGISKNKRKKNLDAIAATLILQSYVDGNSIDVNDL